MNKFLAHLFVSLFLISPSWSAPITFQYDSFTDATRIGLSAFETVRVKFTFDSNLANGTGGFGTSPTNGSYGPWTGTLTVGTCTVSLTGGTIEVFNDAGTTQKSDGYDFRWDKSRGTASGAFLGGDLQFFRVLIVNNHLNMLSSTALPTDPGFAARGEFIQDDYFVIANGNFIFFGQSEFSSPGRPFTLISQATAGRTKRDKATDGCGPREVTVVDPVPVNLQNDESLLDVNAPAGITTDVNRLASKNARTVEGIAADGVSQVVIQIPALSQSELIRANIKPDPNCAASSSVDMGGLYDALSPPSTVFNNNFVSTTPFIPLRVANTPNGPMAFLVYRAPTDFVRTTCANADQLATQRTVTLIFDNGMNELPIEVVRPPVAVVHGLWAESKDLGSLSENDEKSGLKTKFAKDPRFSMTWPNYGTSIEIIQQTPPFLENEILPLTIASKFPSGVAPIGSALGFDYGAKTVLPLLKKYLQQFRSGENRPSLRVAASQFDIVAHSMGNLVTRSLPRVTASFYSSDNYQRGYLHKHISVVGPHLGSPFATEALKEANSCTRSLVNFAANRAMLTAEAKTSPSGDIYKGSGAVGDMRGLGNQVPAELSPAINSLNQNPPRIHVPIAYLTGVMSPKQIAALVREIPYTQPACDHPGGCGSPPVPEWLNVVQVISAICPNDPMPKKFLGQDQFFAFMSSQSDGVVPLSSQLNGLPISYTTQVASLNTIPGVLHSPGTGALYNLFQNTDDELRITILDFNGIEMRIFDLLNIPVSNGLVYK